MSLTTLVRMIGALAIGWTLVAIGIGASGARLPDPEATVPLHPVSPPVDAMPENWPSRSGYHLVDRTTGRLSPMRLPDAEQWSMVSVSPWRGPAGELEAIGRWINSDGEDFSGWGLFRLSDGAVLSRVAMEILPSGRPCWVPGQPRTILFAAGDGRLYRCRVAPGDEDQVGRRSRLYATGRAETSEPVAWEVTPPGVGDAFLTDPVWPEEPRLKKRVFVTLMQLERRAGRLLYREPEIWWLEISDNARAIVAAGRLIPTTEHEADRRGEDLRFPTVAVSPAGELSLVYLQRSRSEKSWRLRSAALELDARTNRPMVVSGSDRTVPEPGDGLQAAPLLISTDGSTVYGLSRSHGLAVLPVGRTVGSVHPGRLEGFP